MKAKVQYNDFIGTIAADIPDALGATGEDSIKGLAKFFDINENKFFPIGISLSGTDAFNV